MSRMTLKTTREPKRSSFTGSSRHMRKALSYAALVFRRADNQQETPTAGARDLRPISSSGESKLNRRINLNVGHTRRQLSLCLPALPHYMPDAFDITFSKMVDRRARQVSQQVEAGQRIAYII